MKARIRRLSLLGALGAGLAAPAAAGPDASPSGAALDVAGLWLTDDGAGHVEIVDCGDESPCGRLVWIAPGEEGPGVDANNPDPALRARPLIGLPIIGGFERRKDKWKNGWIYDPEDGKTYRSVLQRQEDGALRVKGCVGPFCRSLVWTPVGQGE